MPKTRRSYLRAAAGAIVGAISGCADINPLDDDDSMPPPIVGSTESPEPKYAQGDQTVLESQRVKEILAASSISELVSPPSSPAVGMTEDEGWKRWDKSSETWIDVPIRARSFAEADLPTPGVPGRLVWNSDRKAIAFEDGDDWEYPVVGDDILLEPATVSDTTTETLIWDAGVDAGSLKVGRAYEISLFGGFTNDSTSDNVTLNFYLGGTLVGSVQSTGKNATSAPWRAKMIFTVRDAGGSGTVKPHTLAKFNQEDADDHHATETVDTASAKTIEVKAKWNNAKAGNSITLGQGYMKEIA